MRNPQRRLVMIAMGMAVLVVAPLAVLASDAFTDVPDSNVHHDDIGWLADSGVTFGCNPPDNTEFCPGEPVLRQQMASFMRRLAEGEVVDAATAINSEEADHAGDSDTLAGQPPSAYQTVVTAASCGVEVVPPGPVIETTCLPAHGGVIGDGVNAAVFNLEVNTDTAGTLQLSSTSLSGDTIAWSFTLDQGCSANAVTLLRRAINGHIWGADPGLSTAAHMATPLPAGSHDVRLCGNNNSGGPVDLLTASLALDWTAGGSAQVQGDQPSSPVEIPDLLDN